uniref:Eukaryotic translation initiation factor 2 alpha kinase 2 n=1 Tax=Anolis carolinensis TaxID=28377 RepID=A0A803T8K8_ANOCA
MAANHRDPHVCMAKLHEYCQRNRLQLEYLELDIRGPPHDRIFTVAVQIDKIQYRQCEGKTKKEAKAHAAVLAWESIETGNEANLASEAHQQPLHAPLQLPSPLPAANITAVSTNYISLLNEYALKNKKIVEFGLESKDGPDHKPVFSQSCKIDGEILGVGTGNNKNIAKFNAAKMAYEKLTGQATARAENDDAPSDSIANGSMSDSLGASKMVTRKSLSEAVHVASDSSEYVIFQNTNGDVLSSESNSISDKLASKPGDIHLDESSPSFLASPKGSATKLKRLAPNFSMLPQRESRYTVNERFLSEFTDIEKLDSGGYGNVFKAKHKIDNKTYAVKRVKLMKGKEEKTYKEVKVLAELAHENIVRYFGCWIGEDTFASEESIVDISSVRVRLHNCLFIQMDYCEKGTLKKWMEEDGGKEGYYEDVLLKFQQIMNGVEFIHKQDYIHRDLKPLNIFISGDNNIKIGDLGLATSGIDEQHTECKGTKLYMAPEQAWSIYGKEVDIFSLGLILFEMLSTFQTYHEKETEILKAKKGNLPKTFKTKFPREVYCSETFSLVILSLSIAFFKYNFLFVSRHVSLWHCFQKSHRIDQQQMIF